MNVCLEISDYDLTHDEFKSRNRHKYPINFTKYMEVECSDCTKRILSVNSSLDNSITVRKNVDLQLGFAMQYVCRKHGSCPRIDMDKILEKLSGYFPHKEFSVKIETSSEYLCDIKYEIRMFNKNLFDDTINMNEDGDKAVLALMKEANLTADMMNEIHRKLTEHIVD